MNEIRLNARIATININGETRIIFPDKYNSIIVRADSEIGISPLPNKNIGDENVLRCKANESTVYAGVYNTYVYFIGTGTIEIILGNNFSFNPFKVVGGSGSGSAVLGTKSISQNGTYNAADDAFDGYSRVTVDVSSSINLQELTVSETGTYRPDAGYDGFSKVTVQSSDEVLQYATVGFKVYMGDSPWTTSYAGKWLCIDLYIDGEMCLHRSAGVYLEYETDRFDSVTVSSVSADSYSITFRLDITGAFHQDGEGRKTSVTAGSVFYDNDIATPPISTIAQARAAVNAGKFVVVIDV